MWSQEVIPAHANYYYEQECDKLISLTEQEKKEIVYELRGITHELDMQFERMLLYNKVSSKKYGRMESHLNNIVDLLMMYLKVINSMEN